MLAKRVRAARPSATKAMTAKATALRDAGRDVIALSQGEPDFDTPAPIREAGIAAIRSGKTRYTPVAGILPLREAICEKFARDNGLTFTPDRITVGCGAKQVIFNALLATLDAGDEVIVPSPCWVSYPEMVKLAGGRPVVVPAAQENGYKLSPATLEKAITPRTKWLILNSPNNPSGAVYSRSELAALAKVLRRHPAVWVLADDIYEQLVYAPAEFSTMAAAAPDLTERILTVNGVSKANCMTGWRVGYGAGPTELIAAMNLVQGQTSSHTSSVSQYAALEAIAGDQGAIVTMREIFRKRRDLVLTALAEAQGLRCAIPAGAFYVFPDCSGLLGRSAPGGVRLMTDNDVALYLLEEAGVAVVSGSSFMANGHIRLSYASSEDELSKACERIVAACGAVS